MKKTLFSAFALLVIIGSILTGCDVDNETAPDVEAPNVLITYPGNWSTLYSEEIEVHLDVLDEHPIDSVMVFMDGDLIASFTNAPYIFTLQKANYVDGQHTILAQATDDQGNIGNSELLNFFWMQEAQQSAIMVDIVRPILWEKFVSSQISLQILCESTQTIDSIAVYVDGEQVHTFFQAPYEATLTVNSQGVHNIYAIAVDALGFRQSTTLNYFEVAAADVENPTGFIASPADWSNVSGNFDVHITAHDNVAVNRVELFVDGVLNSQSTTAPYDFTLDSTNLTNENHTLYATVYDSSENLCITQLVNVRVQN